MNITKDMLHPELRFAGSVIRRLFRFKTGRFVIPAQRAVCGLLKRIKPAGLHSSQTFIEAPGNPALRLCIYSAKVPQPGAVGLLWLHGGGYAIGSPELELFFIRRFINAANCVVVAPDYRLSPDAPYPAAADDCYAALLWLHSNAEKLGVRRDKLFVGGDSAGGGLTVAVALMARDESKVNVAFHMPLYPMLDDRAITESSRDNDAPVWDSAANAKAWALYLGPLCGADSIPAYAAPARETNHDGLPPAYTFTGDIEPFFDETVQYAQNLRAAGISAGLDIYPGCFHAFDILCPWTDVAKKATARCMEQFKYAAENYSSDN